MGQPSDATPPPSNDADPDFPPEDRGREKGGRAAWMRALRDVAPYLDLGWRLAGTAAFPPLIGYAVDTWLQTTPWALLGGCVVGLAGSVVQLRRLQDEFSS